MKKLLTSVVLLASLMANSANAQNFPEIQTQKVVASDREANDQYGSAVDIDGNRAIVGARTEDRENASSAGSAYIYELEGGEWIQKKKLVASDAEALDDFAWSVSIDGDYAIVGAYKEHANSFSDAGSAYIFFWNGSDWIEQAKITADDISSDDNFGSSVHISGDFVIVGAPNEDEDAIGGSNIREAGSAYIFERSGTSWSQTQKIVASDRAIFNEFGFAVSIDGNTAVVGSPYDDVNGHISGSAYIFTYDGSNWNETQKVLLDNGSSFDQFGRNVDISGNKIIIGAIGEDEDANGSNFVGSAGSAYILSFDGVSWSQEAMLLASDRATRDEFGFAVSIDGDNAIVGAYGNDDIGFSSGSAYIYNFDGNGWNEVTKIIHNDISSADWFGGAVAISGINAIVGAPFEDEDENGTNFLTSAGSVYFFGPYPYTGPVDTDNNGFTEINDLRDLLWISENDSFWSADMELEANIDVAARTILDNGMGFMPIGNENNPFSGTFNGNGFTITNLEIENGGKNAGMFGVITGTVENLSIESADIEGGFGSGIVAGANLGTIRNVDVTGNLRGHTAAGPIAGWNAGTIEDVDFNGTVAGRSSVGGVVGLNTGMISNAMSEGRVEGKAGIGGVAGRNEATIENSMSDSEVSGTSRTGEVVGTVISGSSFR